MGSETLYIFDFDDTLVSSGANVKVVHSDNTTSFLKSHEFATYTPLPGDVFDFTEFDVYPPDGKLIKNTFRILKKTIASNPHENIMILSARGETQPMIDYLKDQGISEQIEFVGVGSSNPESKSDVVIRKLRLKPGGYSRVIIYEDSIDNIDAITKAILKLKKGIKVIANKVEIKHELMIRSTIRAIISKSTIKK